MTYPKIKPCPDCANVDMSMFGYGDRQPYNWHVECEDCNYLGPCGNKLQAIRLHNERVATKQACAS
ncbi:MAG: hypothetical protein V4523_14170 [Pseudomonadota bacterium]